MVLDAIVVRFGGLIALDAVSATFTQSVNGIIGPNGAGKTTLMNVISGFQASTSGRVTYHGNNLLDLLPHTRARWGLRRSFQREQIADDLTVWGNILAMADNTIGNMAEKRLDVERAAEFAGVTHIRDKLGLHLNTVERRLTDIARCVVGRPKFIMLDEPAGGMMPEETLHLSELIMSIPMLTGAQVLIIDHDVELIERICAETLVLDFGRRIAFGPTSKVLNDPAVQSAYLGTAAGEPNV